MHLLLLAAWESEAVWRVQVLRLWALWLSADSLSVPRLEQLSGTFLERLKLSGPKKYKRKVG
jgi:hypothetical protein